MRCPNSRPTRPDKDGSGTITYRDAAAEGVVPGRQFVRGQRLEHVELVPCADGAQARGPRPMISGSAGQHKRVLHAGAPRAPGLEKSTQKMTAPSQQTFSGSPRAADDHGIHVTSHSGQVIRLPTPGTPRLPQFQHSLGSALCWLPLICFPPQLSPHDRDLRPGRNACTWRRPDRRRLIHPRGLPMGLRAVSRLAGSSRWCRLFPDPGFRKRGPDHGLASALGQAEAVRQP